MKITVRKAAEDVFVLAFGDIEVVVDGAGIETLVRRVAEVLGAGVETTGDRLPDFFRHLKNANDVGVQRLLLMCDHEDVLVLLKVAEKDEPLLDKLYGNMSERSHKMCAEDMAYRFKEGVSSAEVDAALARLMDVARQLEDEGALVYENVRTRRVVHGAPD